MYFNVQPPASVDAGEPFPWPIVALIQHNRNKNVWYTAELVAKNVTSGQRVQLATVQSRGDSTNYMSILADRRDDMDYLIFKDIAIPESLVGQCELTVKVMRNTMTGGAYQGNIVSDKFTVTKQGKSPKLSVSGKLGLTTPSKTTWYLGANNNCENCSRRIHGSRLSG